MTTMTRQQGGPPLLAPALAFGVLTVASAVLGAAGTRPDSSAAEVAAYLGGNQGVVRLLAFAVFGASVPLAVWAATAYRRQRRLGVAAPGAVIGLTGGVLSAAALAMSGLITWTAAQASDAPAVARALTSLAFASGGPGFVVPLALLIAGIAVPALFLKLLPRWMSVAGLVVAAAAVLASLSLLTPALYPLIPVGRFGGLVWLVAASVLLPRDRAARTD
ncbi:DUF4386 domain-containing protein [Amycolatopsis echigonensis]|uniref:DUF4386 domain-containing protein n=1 Tax=Amycolatopsis echigonensis TaxID=2576905 RepID=A0A8E1W3E6_9PSEU|nr:DUF4386 domain-containing protein [Amycolatopsis echigonensis]MBB2503395.1 DUF4386 domain-containing protein [Amycolatopsis echigonensis]